MAQTGTDFARPRGATSAGTFFASPASLAPRLGTSRRTAQRWAAAGLLPAVRTSPRGRWRVLVSAVDAWQAALFANRINSLQQRSERPLTKAEEGGSVPGPRLMAATSSRNVTKGASVPAAIAALESAPIELPAPSKPRAE